MKHPLTNRLLTVLFFALLIFSCKEDEEKLPPEFHEFSGRPLSSSSIAVNTMISPRSADIIESFFVYGTNPGLTQDSPNKVLVNNTAFEQAIENLAPSTRYYFKAFIVSSNFDVVESTEIEVITTTPEITSFPASGFRGENVIISGTALTTNTSDYVVKFGDYPATVTGAAFASLSVLVPETLPRGDFKISVTIGEDTYRSGTNFRATNMPVITSMDPIIGVPGTTVHVQGKDFEFSSGLGPVSIGGVKVSASNINNADPDNASFIFTVPSSLTPGQYNVMTHLGDRTSTASQKFTVPASPWAQATNLTGAREGAVSFTIGSKGYVALGTNNGPLIDLWEYDMTNGTWTKKADFPGEARYDAVAFSIGSKGYVGCGNKETFTTLKDFWEYNPASNTWTKLADFGGTARAGAVGVSINGKGYIGLGRDASALKKDWWEYNASANTWTQRADFTGNAREFATAVTIGSKGYVGLGNQNSLAVLADFYEYDPANNTWTTKASFGGGGRSTAVGFVIDGQAIVGSGFNAGIDATKDFWSYDPSSNQWTKLTVDLDVARFAAVSFVFSSQGFPSAGYIVSGHSTSGALLADVWKYTP